MAILIATCSNTGRATRASISPAMAARWIADGYFWLLGRVDDVMNVAGHRISTYEVESALVDHPSVAESAVIGKTHEVKGQGISAFVTLKEGIDPSDALKEELKQHVVAKIGAIARPDDIFFAAELPKTRSAKIMRRLLRDIAEGRVLGDTTTLADSTRHRATENAIPGRRLTKCKRMHKPHASPPVAQAFLRGCAAIKASAITSQTMMERRIGGNATDRLHHYSRIFSANRTLSIVLIAATPTKKIATVAEFARETCPA